MMKSSSDSIVHVDRTRIIVRFIVINSNLRLERTHKGCASGHGNQFTIPSFRELIVCTVNRSTQRHDFSARKDVKEAEAVEVSLLARGPLMII